MKTDIPIYAGSVRIGLYYIKGNQAPYFSATSRNGADHDAILRNYPELFDVVALHLSDINGTPMYAVENGVYHIEHGTVEHVMNHFRLDRVSAQCLITMANKAIPVDPAEIRKMAESAGLVGKQADEVVRKQSKTMQAASVRKVVAAWCENQKPVWKAQADACIKRHNLKVYGDPWPHDIDSF